MNWLIRLKGSEDYLVPSLLQKDSLYFDNWNKKDCLGFRYNYENSFIHESIMSRFIVRMNRYIDEKKQWLTGVLLRDEYGNKALVKADLLKGYITILINGNQNTRRDFLSIIRENFRDIHQGNRPKEEVSLKNFPNEFVSYRHLWQLEEAEIEELPITIGRTLIKYNVRELLNNISSFEIRKLDRQTKSGDIRKTVKMEAKINFDVAFSFAGEDPRFCRKSLSRIKR